MSGTGRLIDAIARIRGRSGTDTACEAAQCMILAGAASLAVMKGTRAAYEFIQQAADGIAADIIEEKEHHDRANQSRP